MSCSSGHPNPSSWDIASLLQTSVFFHPWFVRGKIQWCAVQQGWSGVNAVSPTYID
jgi:hypothetical protein